MADSAVNERDLSALRIELGNRIAAAEGRSRTELKPIALQVDAITFALEQMRARIRAPASLSEAEIRQIRADIDVLEKELARLLSRIEALERRPPSVVYAGGGGGPGPAGPAGPAGPQGPPAAATNSYWPQGW